VILAAITIHTLSDYSLVGKIFDSPKDKDKSAPCREIKAFTMVQDNSI